MDKSQGTAMTPLDRGVESTALLLGAAVMKKLNFDDDLITEDAVCMTIEKFPWIIEHARRKDVMGGAFKTFMLSGFGATFLLKESMGGPGIYLPTMATMFLNTSSINIHTKKILIGKYCRNMEFLENFKVNIMTYRVARLITDTIMNIDLHGGDLFGAYVAVIDTDRKNYFPFQSGLFYNINNFTESRHAVTVISISDGMFGRRTLLLETMDRVKTTRRDLNVGDVIDVHMANGKRKIEKIGSTNVLRPELALYGKTLDI